MFMHPYVMEELARQRKQELRRSVRGYTPPRQFRRRRCGCISHRAGWVLIEIGLALPRVLAMPDTRPRGGDVNQRKAILR